MAKTDTLYSKAMELSKSFDENFVELAQILRTLHEGDPQKFRDFVNDSGTKSRKAYYLIAIDKTFGPLGVSKDRLTKIGWTKISIIEPYVNHNNIAKMLDYAEQNNAAQLKKLVKGEDAIGDAHAVLMYFSPENYQKLVDALIMNGAERSGRGLVNKEEALMRMIDDGKK